MFLTKIYSEPKGLFNDAVCKNGVIEFKNGINYIYGKKDSDKATESLNGIGKSLLLDLVDFCLLSSIDKSGNPRLFEAKEHLSGYKIVLEFKVNNTDYIIKRSVDKVGTIEFGKKGSVTAFENRIELSERLCDLIFKDDSYKGYYENNLFRKLMPFFLKIHKHKQQKFTDPIEYLKGCYATELNQYHLLLMGVDNSLMHENYEIQIKLKDKEPALKEIKRFVESTYGLKKITDADSEIDNLNREIKKLDNAVKTFKLADKYKDAESQANKFTEELKQNIFLNFSDQNKVKLYKESFQIKDDVKSLKKVKNIYTELNELIGKVVKKTIEDAVIFREQLSKSREKFLASEITELEASIKKREKTITDIENERAKIFGFLEAKEAIKDLTEAFSIINEKKKKINDLESRVKIYNDLSKEKAELNIQESQLEKAVLDYLANVKSQLTDFRDIFSEVYNSVYPENKNKSYFSISPDLAKKSKVSIEVNIPAMRSEGKNQGRTLIYDIAILLNAIEKNIKCPRFLVHDGIFDGMDRAHFVAICNFLYLIDKKGKKFQYIIPINEEGELDDKFGKIDAVTKANIEKEAILILTPSKKLLGKSWN
jgi:uncharacterized protein YydD (DUF2326 family)